MNKAMLKAYLDGWAMICASTSESTEAMIAGAHPDIRFSDVNSPNVHHGHGGLRTLCALAGGKYPDARIAWRDLLFDGRNWSVRWIFTGTAPDGTRFSHPGASAGVVADDGRVIEHTDYWNRPGAN